MGRERVSLLKVSSFQGCPTLERGVSRDSALMAKLALNNYISQVSLVKCTRRISLALVSKENHAWWLSKPSEVW